MERQPISDDGKGKKRNGQNVICRIFSLSVVKPSISLFPIWGKIAFEILALFCPEI